MPFSLFVQILLQLFTISSELRHLEFGVEFGLMAWGNKDGVGFLLASEGKKWWVSHREEAFTFPPPTKYHQTSFIITIYSDDIHMVYSRSEMHVLTDSRLKISLAISGTACFFPPDALWELIYTCCQLALLFIFLCLHLVYKNIRFSLT